VSAEWFWAFIHEMQTNVWVQGLVIVAGAMLLEDVVNIGVAILVATGDIVWYIALPALTLGIFISDMVLYLLGRFAAGFLNKLVNQSRLLWAEAYFSRHMVRAVIAARFLPGVRMVTFTAAGALRIAVQRYAGLVSLITFLQICLYLLIAQVFGVAVLESLQQPWLRTTVAVVALAVFLLFNFYMGRRFWKSKAVD